MSTDRRAELADALARLERRLADACRAAGRDRSELTLVAVTKTFPATDARELVALGVRELGENRDQEAVGKVAEVPGAHWHFVGALQTNKAASVAGYADLVHSLDRPGLATALARGAQRAERVLDVLLQVSLDGDPARSGVPAAELPALAEQVVGAPGLQLRGLMAVAPRKADPARVFESLARLADRLRRNHPEATLLSAGMSGDLEQAVAAGATHVRIGTALLGGRTTTGR